MSFTVSFASDCPKGAAEGCACSTAWAWAQACCSSIAGQRVRAQGSVVVETLTTSITVPIRMVSMLQLTWLHQVQTLVPTGCAGTREYDHIAKLGVRQLHACSTRHTARAARA